MGRPRQSRRVTRRQAGYSLVELVTVITITGIVALVPAQVLINSMQVYTSLAPRMEASYQARLACERLKRDFRELASRGSITVRESDAVTFLDRDDETIAYALSDSGELTRNGFLLAQDVSALSLVYRDELGAKTGVAARVDLLEIDLTVTIAGQSYRQRESVTPRYASDPPGPLDEIGATYTTQVRGSTFTVDLISAVTEDIVIDTFALSADSSMPDLKELRIDGSLIYSSLFGVALPTGDRSPNLGLWWNHTIEAEDTREAAVKFESTPTSGDSVITLLLNFTDGSSSTLTLPMEW